MRVTRSSLDHLLRACTAPCTYAALASTMVMPLTLLQPLRVRHRFTHPTLPPRSRPFPPPSAGHLRLRLRGRCRSFRLLLLRRKLRLRPHPMRLRPLFLQHLQLPRRMPKLRGRKRRAEPHCQRGEFAPEPAEPAVRSRRWRDYFGERDGECDDDVSAT
jgi:hypothetical protein